MDPTRTGSSAAPPWLENRSLLDFHVGDIADAKRLLGMDSERSRKLDGLLDGWREVERSVQAELTALDGGPATKECPTASRPPGNGQNQQNCDLLSPVHDQMIDLIRLAFEWDLTRVVPVLARGTPPLSQYSRETPAPGRAPR